MNNEEIITKAIQKAIDGGWDKDGIVFYDSLDNFAEVLGAIIFNRNFASALWGNEKCYYPMANTELGTMWQYHLQAMVISNDPIKYLGDNI